MPLTLSTLFTSAELISTFHGSATAKTTTTTRRHVNDMTISMPDALTLSPSVITGSALALSAVLRTTLPFLLEHAIFRHLPNKTPLTDRSEILHS
jgi:hypothetical protein